MYDGWRFFVDIRSHWLWLQCTAAQLAQHTLHTRAIMKIHISFSLGSFSVFFSLFTLASWLLWFFFLSWILWYDFTMLLRNDIEFVHSAFRCIRYFIIQEARTKIWLWTTIDSLTERKVFSQWWECCEALCEIMDHIKCRLRYITQN